MKTILISLIWLFLGAPVTLLALILSSEGNHPVSDHGWPLGALAVANLPSRIGWWEGPPFGGGQWNFNYRGNSEALNEALTNFAAIVAPELNVVIHDGPKSSPFGGQGGDSRFDWSFTVWVPENWHRLYNDPRTAFSADDPNFRKAVAAPQLDIYVGGGLVDWGNVKVPAKVHVRDERGSAAGANLSAGSMVSVDVFDMANGKAVSNARVLVEKSTWQTAPNPRWISEQIATGQSDANGHAPLANIPPGFNRISVSADGYVPRWVDQNAHDRAASLKYSVNLAKAAALRGVVTESGNKGIRGVKVQAFRVLGMDGLGYFSLESYSAETDAGGNFELTGLPIGYVQLTATVPGYFFGDVQTFQVVPSSNIVLHVVQAGNIHVSVFDKDGKPLSHFENNPLLVNVESTAGLQMGSWGGGAQVKDDGTCDFANVPPGEYRISSRPNPASSNQPYAAEQILTVSAEKTATAKITYQ